jgi:predicted unusual protein kinase regulating ubiquinone biosynthesis (AarF/ABC1/UbiB family)
MKWPTVTIPRISILSSSHSAPKTYPEFTTRRLMAMEYVLDQNYRREKILEAGLDPVDISVKMSRHSSNNYVVTDSFTAMIPIQEMWRKKKKVEQGQSRIFYDFGMMDFFNEEQRKLSWTFLCCLL